MNRRGQILMGVIIIMMVMAVLVPVMVMYTQTESKWAEKNRQNMSAFQLAEAGIDRGYRKISESTTTWENSQNAVFPPGYTGTLSYSDLEGGCYTIDISSGPDDDQVTIIATGIDSRKKEVRSIRAVYANSPMGDTAIRAGGTVGIGGSNTQVHWGAIVTPEDVDVNGRIFPQIWTAGDVDLDANGASPPNCDQPNCVQWHSYDSNIPPDPGIDTNYFYEAAVSSGTDFYGNQCWGKNAGTACGATCTRMCSPGGTSCETGKPYWIEGDLCVEGKVFVQGTLFVQGNLQVFSGLTGADSRDAIVPRKAWMQYGNDTAWDDYLAAWDPTRPAAFPGLSSSYLSPANTVVALDRVLVEGFLYVGGNYTQPGGAGQTKIIGAAYIAGNVDVQPNNFYVYYSDLAGQYVKTMNVFLSRQSWRDEPGNQWPSALTCP